MYIYTVSWDTVLSRYSCFYFLTITETLGDNGDMGDARKYSFKNNMI